jgi:sterol desaturase/sphingolipid hydroxylase (fatty acid hydroxylase superfamily)
MENKNEHQLKRIVLICLFIGILIPFIYYFNELKNLISTPGSFIQKFLKASQLSNWTFKAFLITIFSSISAFILEILAVGWKNSGLKKILNLSKSAKQDLWCYLLSIVNVFDFIVFVSTLGIFYVLTSLLDKYIHFQFTNHLSNPIFQFIILFIFADLIHYIRHRFNHWGVFWELHAHHHSATEFNLITTVRGSFWEAGFNSVFYSLVYLIGGFYIENILLVHALRDIHLHLCHSNVNWNYGIFGKYVFITPLDHRLHHSVKRENYDLNFGAVFKWWDILFSTYKKNNNAQLEIGIDDKTIVDSSFFKGQWYASVQFLQRILNNLTHLKSPK